MAECTALKIRFHKPAVRSAIFEASRSHGGNRAAEKAGRVHEMAAVCQDEIPALIRLGISLRFARSRARARNRLQIVRHCVAVGGVIIPRAESEDAPHLLTNESRRE